MATNWFFRFLDWARETPWLMGLVILTCLGVGGWGFYDYYGAQFEWIGLQHWYVFAFVPDCPLFVYLFAFVMIGKYAKIQHPAFTAFVAVGNIKYGIWTVFVLLYYYDLFFGSGGGDAAFRGLILLLHVGMIPLGILLWRGLGGLRRTHVVGVLVALLVYDYFDYFFTSDYQVYPIGLPSLPGHRPLSAADLGLVPWFTVAESLVLVAGLWMSQRLAFDRPAPRTAVDDRAPILAHK